MAAPEYFRMQQRDLNVDRISQSYQAWRSASILSALLTKNIDTSVDSLKCLNGIKISDLTF